MTNKKLVLATMVAAALAFGVAACGPKAETAPEEAAPAATEAPAAPAADPAAVAPATDPAATTTPAPDATATTPAPAAPAPEKK